MTHRSLRRNEHQTLTWYNNV